ncbi:MAG: ParB N-terminal domain-containing protein [Bacillaceae bacterium]|nr:ParB N-terminal domain-containing protein [Bacillaceae bacterium]
MHHLLKDPWRNTRYARAGKVGEVPTRWLMKFRGNHLRRSPGRMARLTEDIRKNGIRKPLMLLVGKQDRRVQLAEGNHRLVAAFLSRMDTVPVYVMVQRNIVFGQSAVCREMNKLPRTGHFPSIAHPDQVFDRYHT